MVLRNLFVGQQQRNSHRGETYRHGERGGEVEMYGQSNMETYITICKIDSQRKFSVQGLCINLEGWDEGGSFTREGIYVYHGSEIKASASNAGDLGSVPGLGRSPGEGNGNPLQHSCVENPVGEGAW